MVTTYLRAIFSSAESMGTVKYSHKAILRMMEAVNSREKIIIYGKGNREGICSIAMLILMLRYFNADFDYFLIPKGGNKESLVADVKTHLNFYCPDVLVSLEDSFTESVYETLREEGKDLIAIGHQGEEVPYGFQEVEKSLLKTVFHFAKGLSDNYDTRNVYRYTDLVYLGIDAEEAHQDDLLDMGLDRLRVSTNYGIRALKKMSNEEDTQLRALVSPKDNPWSMVDNARIIIELLTTEDTHRAEQIAKYLVNS